MSKEIPTSVIFWVLGAKKNQEMLFKGKPLFSSNWAGAPFYVCNKGEKGTGIISSVETKFTVLEGVPLSFNK